MPSVSVISCLFHRPPCGLHRSSSEMVVLFRCELVSPPYLIYMGSDKAENDELIRWGWPEDVWFHVDKFSSAHVYLRLRDGESLDDVPETVIQDCAQLVKANSIQGSKQNDVDVVYTMWSNLRKLNHMAVGQVGFHDNHQVRKLCVERRIGETIKRLDKTRQVVEKPDLRVEREARDKRIRDRERQVQIARQRVEREAAKVREEEAERRSYDRIFTQEKMRSNADGYDSDDFI
ncbi:unnamed protein product [Protopolystoma xenopodis]|uniref:Coiled-coil domain-containing protein 25 n=1 Tax=Protopolystoma xenopodis TaxID=117903 RepID=A0A448WRB0_9PLAT|nr:unnamed protein product [Protopolystoma xenopodis]